LGEVDFGDLVFFGDSLVFLGEEGDFLVAVDLAFVEEEVFFGLPFFGLFSADLGGVLLVFEVLFLVEVFVEDFLAIFDLSDDDAEVGELLLLLGAFFVEDFLGEEGALVAVEDDEEEDFFLSFFTSGLSL